MAELNDLLNTGDSLKTPGLGGTLGGSSNKDLRALALTSLSGNWGWAILGPLLYFFLVISFFVFVFSLAFFVSMVGALSEGNVAVAANAMKFFVRVFEILVNLLVPGALVVGFVGFFLGIAQEGEACLEVLFVGFRRFWKSFGVCFLSGLFVCLWSLLLVIPGIVAALRYAMVYFIIADDEDCGSLEAIRRSKEMMKGNKWKFFRQLWLFHFYIALATVLTLGIYNLKLIPYMMTTFAKFYEDVK